MIVKSVVPGGPAVKDNLLCGDVLVSIDGQLVTLFPDLEAILDDQAGRTLAVVEVSKLSLES